MLNEDNIKDIFNKFPNEDQSWLEPTDDLLSGIEDRIYEKKKDRKPVWFLFLGSIIIILACLIIIPILSEEKEISLTNIEDIKTSVAITNNSALHPNTIQDNATQADQSNTVLSQTSIVENDISQRSKTQDHLNHDQNIKQNKSTTVNQSSQRGIVTNNIEEHSFPNRTKSIANGNQSKNPTDITNNDGRIYNTENPNQSQKNIKVINENLKLQLLYLQSISSITPALISTDEKLAPTLFQESIRPATTHESTDENDAALILSSGFSIWDFHLNDNYQTALSPADFTYNNGKGINLGIAYEKNLSSKYILQSSIRAEKITHQSGHNSSVNFDTTNSENQFDLTMASPMGFLESEVIVQRSRINNPSSPNDLILDLHNDHENYNIDFNVSILRELIYKNSFKGLLHIGGGINHLFGLYNTLSQVNIDNSEYSTLSTSITSNQNNLNTTRPYYNIGLSIENSFGKNIGVRISYLYMRDVTALYSTDDFNTRLSRQLTSASLIYSF